MAVTSNESPRRPLARVVALDIGNVCVRLAPEALAQGLGFESFSALMSQGQSLIKIARDMETGRLSEQAFFNRAAELLPQPRTPAQVEHAMLAIIADEMPGMGALVAELRQVGLRPVFLSDISEFQYLFVRRLLSFSDQVPDGVVSYLVGEGKPHVAMYEAMEQRYCDGGVPLLYADDREENIQAARARGWRSYHFGTATGCRAALQEALAALPRS